MGMFYALDPICFPPYTTQFYMDLKSRIEILIDSGTMVPFPAYAKIASCLNHFVRKMRPNGRSNGSSRTILDEFLPLKNPGKKMRASLTKKLRENNDISKAKFITKFRDLTQTSLLNNESLGTRVSLWNLPGLSNRVRTFTFKFFNNILGLNTRISHFVPGQTRDCTFCIGTIGPISEETFIHIFYECPTTTSWHEKFLQKYFTDPGNLNRNQKLDFFLWEFYLVTQKITFLCAWQYIYSSTVYGRKN
jgi:hypothetical protein